MAYVMIDQEHGEALDQSQVGGGQRQGRVGEERVGKEPRSAPCPPPGHEKQQLGTSQQVWGCHLPLW